MLPETAKLVVLYRCEASLLTLRKLHRFKASGHRALRGMFGPNREEGTAQANEVRSKKVTSLFSLINYLGLINYQVIKCMKESRFSPTILNLDTR
jgi:hypothetical protein